MFPFSANNTQHNNGRGWIDSWIIDHSCISLSVPFFRLCPPALSGPSLIMCIPGCVSASPFPLLLLLLLLGYGCHAADIPEDATAEFSVRLYHRLQAMGGSDSNIIFSPLSVAVALGMMELGARGASLEEIRQAVGFSQLPAGEGRWWPARRCGPVSVHTQSAQHRDYGRRSTGRDYRE